MTPEPPTDVRVETLRLLSGGLFVLTSCAEDTVHAAAVSWISQVSAEPALVLVALRRNSHLAQAVRDSHRFALNILGKEQEEVAHSFLEHQILSAAAADRPRKEQANERSSDERVDRQARFRRRRSRALLAPPR